jgi:methionine aminopeptidase
MEVTLNALYKGIEAAIPGNRVGDISNAIGTYVASMGYYVADDLTGMVLDAIFMKSLRSQMLVVLDMDLVFNQV